MKNCSIEKQLLQDISNYSDDFFSNKIENEFSSKYNNYNFDTYVTILYNIKFMLISGNIEKDEIISNIRLKINLGLIHSH